MATVELSQGWDSTTTLVDERWIERRPRRLDVVDRLVRETRLLPWLAPQLPLAVPVPVVTQTDPLVVRHEAIPGDATYAPRPEHGAQLGHLLLALHEADPDDAVRHGLQDARTARTEHVTVIRRFRDEVVPLLPRPWHAAAADVLDAVAAAPFDRVIHADLGPEHLLSRDGSLTGMIDFGDAHVGDPARDLAWPLHGTSAEFAASLSESYGVSADLRERARWWHRLGPWFEVTYGLDTAQQSYVESGVTGITRRLGD